MPNKDPVTARHEAKPDRGVLIFVVAVEVFSPAAIAAGLSARPGNQAVLPLRFCFENCGDLQAHLRGCGSASQPCASATGTSLVPPWFSFQCGGLMMRPAPAKEL
jgi:hypothetical protein